MVYFSFLIEPEHADDSYFVRRYFLSFLNVTLEYGFNKLGILLHTTNPYINKHLLPMRCVFF